MPTSARPNSAFLPPRSALGPAPAAWGGPPIVLIPDALASAHQDIDDPYDTLTETDSQHANTVVHDIPHGVTHAFVWLYARGVAGFSLSTPPVVRLFGRTPFPAHTNTKSGSKAIDPYEPTFFNANLPNIFQYPTPSDSQVNSGLWLPATEVGYTRGTPGVTLDQIAVRNTAGTPDIVFTEPRLVVVAGFEKLMATLATAASLSGGGTQGAAVMARFVI